MEGVEGQISTLLSSDLDSDERRELLSPWQEPYMYWVGGWVGSSAGLYVFKKRMIKILLLSVVELRLLGCNWAIWAQYIRLI